ncbi:MAG: hypothetical protein ACOVN5_04655 [Aquidulcibacter sp.]
MIAASKRVGIGDCIEINGECIEVKGARTTDRGQICGFR